MEKFLINMAIIKVNWDESRKDILDNYLPLIGYAVKCCDGDVVALEDIEGKLQDIADFKIPRGAIITMLKRARRAPYGYVRKEHLKYIKVPEKLSKLNYERLRDEQTRNFNALIITFRTFCRERYNVDISEEAANEYFFDILYDIAPSLYKNLKIGNSDGSEENEPEITRKYLVSSFIQDVVKNDQTSFGALEAFVRGAMLTETFYYSSPSDILTKFRKTKVFFDTSFILRLLGYCDEVYSKPYKQLHEMLNGMSVKMRCFRKTFNEILGILHAASKQLEHARLMPNRPGDAFDYFTQNGYTSSDVEYEIASLQNKLQALRIYLEEHPPHEKALTVDEPKLDKCISDYIERQREKSRYHDIDCLTSIFRLRRGKPQMYLESCGAIFVTTNFNLARAATKFFNDEYGITDAPVCISEPVFTTLVWLKAVNKIPDLPKERLVANCYAALNPSEELWQKYLKEVDRLYKRNEIGKDDYAVLVHGLEARKRLMDLTLGDDMVCLEGTVPEVLNAAKTHYLAEMEDRITNTERRYSSLTKKVNNYARQWSTYIHLITYWGTLIISFVVLILAMLITSPDDISKLGHITGLQPREILKSVLFIIFVILAVLNIVYGVRLSGPIKWLSDRISRFVSVRIKAKFFSDESLTIPDTKVEIRETSTGKK